MTDSQPTVLGSLWRYRFMSVAIVAVVVALSIGVGFLSAGSVRATASISLTTPLSGALITSGTQSDAALDRFVSQRARFVSSDAVMEQVAVDLDRSDVTALRNRVSATAAGSSNTISLAVSGPSESEAVELAEAVVTAYREASLADFEARTQAAVESIQDTEDDLLAALGPEPSVEQVSSTADTVGQLRLRTSDLLAEQAVYGDGVDFVNEPRRDQIVRPGPPIRETGLGLVVGLVLAATAAWLRADRESGVGNADDLEGVLGVPNLGVVRASADLQLRTPLERGAVPSHDYSIVWSTLLRRVPSGVVVVASEGVDARSVAALNLAAAAGGDHRRVLLVDADLRSRQITFALTEGDRPALGVRSVLDGAGWETAVLGPDDTGVRNLSLLPAGVGPGEPAASTEAVEAAVSAWRSAYDVVVIDTGDVESSRISAALYGAADAVVVVVGRGTNRARLDGLRRRIGLHGAELAGSVFAEASS